jgi:prepilin-type N-terminal cleavage/methylation domain-containing protein
VRSLRQRLCGSDQEAGLTLVELLVTMFLISVISSLVLGAVVQSSRVLVRNEDEERGLQDAKVILDRLGRDVRESRGVVCDAGLADPTDSTSSDPSCQSHLQLWVDSNSDYMQQDAEVITWRLQQNPDGQHFDVWRVVGPDAAPVSRQRQASTLIVKFAFTYDNADFSKVQQVNMRMHYDAFVDRGSGERWVAFSARLRNKGDR